MVWLSLHGIGGKPVKNNTNQYFLNYMGCCLFPPWFLYLILSAGISKLKSAISIWTCQPLPRKFRIQEGVWVGPVPDFQHCLGQPLGVTRNPHTWGHIIFVCLLAWPCSIQGASHSPSRDWTPLPALGAWSHNHSTTRKVPEFALASVFSAILPSPPEDPVSGHTLSLNAYQEGFYWANFLFKNEPRVPVVSWYLLIYSAAHLLKCLCSNSVNDSTARDWLQAPRMTQQV